MARAMSCYNWAVAAFLQPRPCLVWCNGLHGARCAVVAMVNVLQSGARGAVCSCCVVGLQAMQTSMQLSLYEPRQLTTITHAPYCNMTPNPFTRPNAMHPLQSERVHRIAARRACCSPVRMTLRVVRFDQVERCGWSAGGDRRWSAGGDRRCSTGSLRRVVRSTPPPPPPCADRGLPTHQYFRFFGLQKPSTRQT